MDGLALVREDLFHRLSCAGREVGETAGLSKFARMGGAGVSTQIIRCHAGGEVNESDPVGDAARGADVSNPERAVDRL